MFFELCLAELNRGSDAWVFLRGDGVYQGIAAQKLDEPGFTVPISGGWNALLARGIKVYINKRCAQLRGFHKEDHFLPEAQFVTLEKLAHLTLTSDKVVVL